MATYIQFELYKRKFRYYSLDRIDSEFRNRTDDWRPVKIGNHQNYKCIQFKVDGKSILMLLHRIVYFVHNQSWDIYDTSRNNFIDHITRIDGEQLDNSLRNLRVVNHQQNLFNTNANGYSWCNTYKKYYAEIAVNGKSKNLGRFDTAEQARTAYLDAKKIYHIID